MARKKKSNWDNMDPQKSSAAQFITYIASVGNVDERYEIRYEDENIWMSQKMLAAVYGIEVNSINYHIKKIFADAELDEGAVIRKIRITGTDGKSYAVNHYNLQSTRRCMMVTLCPPIKPNSMPNQNSKNTA